MKSRNIVLVVCTSFALWATACEKEDGPVELVGDCTIGEPSAEALKRAGKLDDGSTILHTGKKIKPVGTESLLGTFPIGSVIGPDGTLAVVNSGSEDHTLRDRIDLPGYEKLNTEYQSVDFIDTATGKHKFTLPIKSSFVGAAWHPDGTTLYVSGGGTDKLRRLNWDPSDVTFPAKEEEPFSVFGYPTGLAMNKDGSRLFVTRLHRHSVLALDPVTGAVLAEYKTRSAPYQVELAPDEKRAYASNWSDDSLSVIDLVSGKTITHVTVGKNPEGIAVSADNKTVYVAASDEDHIAVVDAASFAVKHFDLRETKDAAPGISPTDVRLSPDGKRLYVVAANQNAILVLDPRSGERIGAIPTAMYPTEVEITPDNKRLTVVSAKGHGSGPNPDRTFVGGMIRGTAHVMDVPTDAQIKEYDTQVQSYNNVLRNLYSPGCQTVKHPVPVQWGIPSQVIEHVVYIMRENKTYDSLLGDLGPAADGDPDLAVFGEEITPNLHALARRFSNMTNFYNESEQSLQGHIWGSAGWVNDFSEKTWIAMWGRLEEAQIIFPGMEPASVPKRGDLFSHFQSHGIQVRNWGEYMGLVLDAIGKTTDATNFKFPSFYGMDDTRKVQEFIYEIEQGRLADFTFMVLGNDHTLGLSAGAPTPEYMVAENDQATGMVVEAISKSPFWEKTAIFIFEDDPQGNADHIDAHRSISLVVSPWVKRGTISRVRHSFPSLHKTASLILGVPPISNLYEEAAGMYEVFGTEPANIEPFTHIPSNIPFQLNPGSVEEAYAISPKMGRLVEESAKMDFSGYDQAPRLGKLLWEYRKGDTPFPEHLVEFEDEDEEEDDE
jgi:YVTN family beta-propeller protein